MPRSFHKVVARAFWLAAFLGSTGGLWLFFKVLEDAGIPLGSVQVDFWTILAALALTAMGFVIGVAFLWQVIGQIALRLQGWPFKVGEAVEVLTGNHAGTVGEIYEIWESRSQVRLRIGSAEAERVEDVFSGINITRQNKTGEQDASSNGGQRPSLNSGFHPRRG
jgi:hypothetical protein